MVRDQNSRMAQMPPPFDKNQQLEESELVDSLANKASRSHKAMLIYIGFIPETRDLATFVEHYKRSETTENITGAKFATSYKDGNTKRNKKRSKLKKGKKMVRNVIRNNLFFIAISMVKTKASKSTVHYALCKMICKYVRCY